LFKGVVENHIIHVRGGKAMKIKSSMIDIELRAVGRIMKIINGTFTEGKLRPFGKKALLWMKDYAKELGIRKNQLMVGGDSAGGRLTAALSIYARDKGEVAIAFQMPQHPMLDDRMTTESAKDNNAPVWNAKSNFYVWKPYLGELYGTSEMPYYAAPARAENYKGLTTTATFVGELEPFRDETIQYVESLRKAEDPVEFQAVF
jgi:acetyl esterase/lipase